MRITHISIKGFGKLKDVNWSPGPGLNLICGPNEAGKSTLKAFIRAMLYGVKGGRRARDGSLPPAKRFKPWLGDSYAGVLEYRLDNGEAFRVGRNFEKGTVHIHDAHSNDITGAFPLDRETGPRFAEAHLGPDEDTFDRSVAISQLQTAINDEGRKDLLEKLSNLSASGGEELSVSRGLQTLETALNEWVGTGRTTTRPLDRINRRIQELQIKLGELEESHESYLDTRLCLSGERRKHKGLIERKRAVESRFKSSRQERLEALLVDLEELEAKVREKFPELSEDEFPSVEELKERQRDLEETLFRTERQLQEKQKIEAAVKTVEKALLTKGEELAEKARPFSLLGPALAVLGLLLAVAALLMRPSPQWILPGGAGVLFLAGGLGVLILHGLKGGRKGPYLFEANGFKGREEFLSEQAGLKRKEEDLLSVKNQLGDISRLAAEIRTREALLREALVLGAPISSSGQLKKLLDGSLSAFSHSGAKVSDSAARPVSPQEASELEQLEMELKASEIQIKAYETRLEKAPSMEEKLQLLEELSLLSEKKKELEQLGKELQLALDVLSEVSLAFGRDFTPRLNREMSRILTQLTNGRYTDIRSDDQFQLLVSAPETGELVSVQRLSGGALDQVYLSMRLAAVSLVEKSNEALPLFMDDPFLQYDALRMEKAVILLKELAQTRQIFFFTCRESEREKLMELMGSSADCFEL